MNYNNLTDEEYNQAQHDNNARYLEDLVDYHVNK